MFFFCQNYQESQIFRSKLCFFLSFYILLYLSGAKSCPEGNFQFSANSREYTLNMTSYQVTEAIVVMYYTLAH